MYFWALAAQQVVIFAPYGHCLTFKLILQWPGPNRQSNKRFYCTNWERNCVLRCSEPCYWAAHTTKTHVEYLSYRKILNTVFAWLLHHNEMGTSVKLQNLSWYKTGFVWRQALHLLSKLQNWICPKTGQYKTCIVSNTRIEASIQATKPKPWQSHLTSETVEIFIKNEKAGLVSTQIRFWCDRFRVGAKPFFFVAGGLVYAQSRFWSGRFRVGAKTVLLQKV